MFASIRLGRLFGIPLFLHPTFLLLPLWLAFVQRSEGPTGMLFGQALLLSVFGCVVLHELGHCLAARLFGIRTRDITLYPIGGVARLDSTGERPFEEVCIALAGPAVNLVLVCLLAPLVVVALASGWVTGDGGQLLPEGATSPEILGRYAFGLFAGNLVLFLFNLLPVFPMDGGRVLRALLSIGLGRLRAAEVVVPLAFLMAIGLGLLGLYSSTPALVLVALFVCIIGQMELAGLRRYEAARQAEKEEARRAATIDLLARGLPPIERPATGGTVVGVYVWDREKRGWVRA